MTRTSARAKKSKQDVNKKKEESKPLNGNQTDSDGAGESTDKENDSTNYDVEKITHTRIFKGKRQYLVRWKGYTEDSDTWENESALQSCKEILDAFKKEHLAEANSEEEDAEENTEEKGRSKGKKVSKSAKKSNKRTSKNVDFELSQNEQEESNKKTEEEENSDDINSGDEAEEEELEGKGRGKGKKITKTAKKNNKQKGKSSTNKTEDSEVGTEEEPEEEESDLANEKNSKKKGSKKGNKRKQVKEPESSKAKKTKKDDSDDESVTDGKDYEVEKIIEVHTRKDGSREFLIRWKGYKPADDTWEPEAHLDCQELIEKFMAKVDKAKEISTKELRQRSETKRFIPVTPRRGNLRNTGVRPCYQETYED